MKYCKEDIVKKIKRAYKSGNEGQLGRKNNDECYTQKQDVYNELSQWAALDKFRNKNIICPCDTSESAFVKVLTENKEAWGIKSITYSCYNPVTGEGTKYQDVDYSKYDICITNPPFNKYREFTNAIVGNIDFIVLAPFLNRCHPCIGLHLMLNQAYLGFGIELHMTFDNPTKENNYSGTKVVNCDWITSFSEAQAARNEKHFKSGIKYDLYKDEYVEMTGMTMKDGTHPIRVSMSTYPEDFDGWMFACMGVLDNLDQDAYEWYSTGCVKYFNSTNPGANPFAHKISDEMYRRADGKIGFHGVIFRKK